MPLAVNGRFRERRITGVERYATEVLSRLGFPHRVVEPADPGRRSGLAGHAWEQLALPLRVRGEVLWSPCNVGPLLCSAHMVTIHDIAPLEHPEWFAPVYQQIVAGVTPRLIRRARCIIVPSQFTADRIRAHFGNATARIEVIPHGASLPTPAVRSEATGDEPFILAVGTLESRKNLAQLFDALSLLGPAAPLLKVVGGAAGATLLATEVARNVRVDYVGSVDDATLAALMAAAQALVSLSRYEGFDLPAAEAAALGTPLLLSDIPVHRELFPAAIFTALDDVSATATAVLAVTGEQRGRIPAVSDWQTSVGAHERLFAEFVP